VERMSRPVPFAVGLTVAAAIALLLVEWPRIGAWYRPPRPELPAPDEVARMRATVWASGSEGKIEWDVAWFDVPVGTAQKLWRRFQPNIFVSRPPVDPKTPLGEMVTMTAAGRVTDLRFYEAGPDELVFTTDGDHFFRAEPRNEFGAGLGGSLFLARTIRAATPDQNSLSIK
jgi:hypothetical protein